MGETLRLNIRSDPATLAPVRQAIEGLCRRCGFDDDSVGEIGLCVNEALANVIRHAYDGAEDRPIEVSAECNASAVTVQIRDWGNGIDPTTLPPRPPDPLRPGGLGLVCLREMMDGVRFVPQSDGMLLEMSRNRDRPKASTAAGPSD